MFTEGIPGVDARCCCQSTKQGPRCIPRTHARTHVYTHTTALAGLVDISSMCTVMYVESAVKCA